MYENEPNTVYTEKQASLMLCPLMTKPVVWAEAPQLHVNCCVASGCPLWEVSKQGAWQYPDGRVIMTHKEPITFHGGGWVKLGYCGLKQRG